MKRTIFVMLTVVALAMTTGCLRRHCRDNACPAGNCQKAENCCPASDPDPGPRCPLLHCRRGQEAAAPVQEGPAAGPQSAAVAYPYYNLRGPRDFLERNPQSIGP